MRYLAKKTITLIITLFLVSFLTFAAFTVIPGDPTAALLGTDATPERVASLRAELGLDDPFLTRYGAWLVSLVAGDMGTSYSYAVSVRSLLAEKIPTTAALTLMSAVLIVVFSLPIGVFQARHGEGLLGRLATILNQTVMAVPAFFLGILISLVFGLLLHWFIPGDFVSYREDWGGFFHYLLFPAAAIALPRIAMTAKMLRAAILAELDQDYVRTARSRGNGPRGVLYGHALRNALIPVITFLGSTIADIVAGSIVIEQVFSIPGMGRLLVSAISARDYPVVMAIVVIIAAIVVIVNYVVDILYQYIDPRVRL